MNGATGPAGKTRRPLDKKATQQAREKHERGIAILNGFFGFNLAERAFKRPPKHCHPESLRQEHKRQRQARRRARLRR